MEEEMERQAPAGGLLRLGDETGELEMEDRNENKDQLLDYLIPCLFLWVVVAETKGWDEGGRL